MRVVFVTKLRVERDREKNIWRLLSPFVARVNGKPIVVPEGFESDFASVPRAPLAFLLAGDTAHASAVLHDFLYVSGADKNYADRVFLAAMEAEGVPWWRRRMMFSAVSLFGSPAKRAEVTPVGD